MKEIKKLTIATDTEKYNLIRAMANLKGMKLNDFLEQMLDEYIKNSKELSKYFDI